MDRAAMLQRVEERRDPWDFVIIGGGATGVGVAVDAASRGLAVLLLEAHDFGKGTSSRSTKLIHGGVRYLQQGNFPLVLESLRERELLRANAPHLVADLPFIVPSYAWWQRPFYGAGLALYQALAGRTSFGPVRWLTRAETLARLPNANPAGLRGGVLYHDGQFDDARLLIHLALTAANHGATLLNYARVTQLHQSAAGRVEGVRFTDMESGRELHAAARVVINATGPFTDSVRRLAAPDAEPMIAPSQGVHLVIDQSFLGGGTALMVPRTPDGRVMFAIPWHGRTLVGTTDTPIGEAVPEPRPLEREIDFLLETAGHYLARPPSRRDVLSAFAGIRPLVKARAVSRTAALARDHTIEVAHGLLTITGGKWTTYRRMAEHCVDRAIDLAALPTRPCVTTQLPIRGHPAMAEPIAHEVPGDETILATARHEMARAVEDVLARRTRALFLDAEAALRLAPRVAALLAQELGRDAAWQAAQVRNFEALAAGYRLAP